MDSTPRERFQEILKSFTTGSLVSTGSDGLMTGRPMRVARVESDADLWFVTKIGSELTADVAARPRVLVVFQDGGRYLTLNGEAAVSTDRSMIDQLWNESWRVWFPDGQDDPSLALLRVGATHGQYWDNSWLRGLNYAFRAGQAYWKGETPDVPEEVNAKVPLDA